MNRRIDRARELYAAVAATKTTRSAKDVALFVARMILAVDFVYHGSGTLFGAFNGAGIHEASRFYGNVAHLRPGLFFAALGGSVELLGGVAVGLGILGRLGASGLVGDMCIAMITVTFRNGIVSTAPGGGYELNLVLAGLAFSVAVMGTGDLALDTLLRSVWQQRGASRQARNLPPTVPHAGGSDRIAAS